MHQSAGPSNGTVSGASSCYRSLVYSLCTLECTHGYLFSREGLWGEAFAAGRRVISWRSDGMMEQVHFVKSIQIGSSLLLRGIYTSDNLYSIEDMPREMQLTHKKDVEFTWMDVPFVKTAVEHGTSRASLWNLRA